MSKKIPENAKLVFKGMMYDIYHWEQEVFDGTTKTYEVIKRQNSATVIATVGDKIIIQDQEQPFKGRIISLPGGRCEKNEETIDCAKREFLEETGYASEDFFLWKSYYPFSTIFWKNCYYIARNCQKIQEMQLDNGEKIENKSVSFEEFLLLSENELFRHKDLVPDLLAMRLHPEKQAEFKKLLFGK